MFLLPLRASDKDRRRAVGALKAGYVTGRLSTETFEARLDVALTSRSRAALRTLLADLSARYLAAETILKGRPSADPPPWATLILSRCNRDSLIVGRSRSCEVVFGGEAVSRRHARFNCIGSQWYVTDLASTNGTWLNGRRVRRAPVTPGSQVCLGDSFLDIR